MKSKIGLSISLLAAAALFLGACNGSNPFATAPAATAVPEVMEAGLLTAEGRVVPKTFATLAFPVSGEVETIAVSEGQQVEEGALLIGLGKREQYQSALSKAELEVLSAQQELDTLDRTAELSASQAKQALTAAQKELVEARKVLAELDTDAYQNTLDDKETALQKAKDDLDDAQEEADKQKNLDEDNQVRKDAEDKVEETQKAVDSAQRDLDLWKNQMDDAAVKVTEAEAALADAQKEVDNRANGPDADELALAQARLNNAEEAVTAARQALANMDLSAPFGGVVADLHDLAKGQWVSVGYTAVTLADFSEWYVETKDLTELDVVEVSLGQKVAILPDALADVALQGEVTAIKPVYTERSGDVLYTVRVKLNETDERLRWGMTVQVEFE